MLLADLALHFRVYNTGPDRDGGNIRLLDRKGQSKVI
jgi:hypothetical protein